MHGNRTNPWPSSLAENEATPAEGELEHSGAVARDRLQSGPAPSAQFDEGIPRSSGPAPLHSVPRDLELELGQFAAPPSVRRHDEMTTEPALEEEVVDEVFLSLRKNPTPPDEIAAAALLFGIEQDAQSRLSTRPKPKASPEAFAAGASSSSHMAVVPPAPHAPPPIEDKVIMSSPEFVRLAGVDEEVTNPARRIPESVKRLPLTDTLPGNATFPGMAPEGAIESARERAKRQEKTVDTRKRFRALPVLVFVALFLSVILAAVITWPFASAELGESVPPPAAVQANVLTGAAPAVDAPVILPAFDTDIPAPAQQAAAPKVTAKKKADNKAVAVPAQTSATASRDALFQRSRVE